MSQGEHDNEKFELTLKGGGITVERLVPNHLAAQIMNLVLGGVTPLQETRPTDESKAGAASGAPTSLREFLDASKAKKKPDQITAIGHYMAVHEGRSTFSRDDIRRRFATAKEPMPGNFPRDFSLTQKLGAIAEAHQAPGQYYVTKTGIALLERGFN